VNADEGFAEFVAAHRGALSQVAYLLTGDFAAAEDLLQAALTKTVIRWKKVSRYERPEAFVRKVLYHDAVSAWRRLRREVLSDRLPEVPGRSHDEAERVEQRVVFARALRRLSARQRAVLVLRFYEDRSVEETADLLGCSTGTVKSQTSVALARLRQFAPELADYRAGRGRDAMPAGVVR
jgi:RNA polymerase sigma-70 factor (sigma-E family)